MDTDRASDLKVLVCQRGARHRYAVPSLLEEVGLLSSLYTDSCRYSLAGEFAAVLKKLGVKRRAILALAARHPRAIPRKKVFSSDRLILPKLLGGGDSLAPVFRRWGLGGASVVYSMYGEEPDFLEWAKKQGARIIVDVFVYPQTNRLVAAEELRVLGQKTDTKISHEDEHSKRAFDLADILLCPSEWVAEGVRRFSPESSSKIRVVPYGSSIRVAQEINNPKLGTILFAGREPLRKGLHHLAEAAYLLRQAGVEVDVHVAGVSSADVEWIKHRAELTCLGKIPMEQMKREYAQADVFVLPSLSEGQAGVLLEAMACGVAVVATRESGVDFEADCGVTVPAGNPAALADALKSVLENRSNRTQLAEGALRQAGTFAMSEWKQRLIHIVEELGQ